MVNQSNIQALLAIGVFPLLHLVMWIGLGALLVNKEDMNDKWSCNMAVYWKLANWKAMLQFLGIQSLGVQWCICHQLFVFYFSKKMVYEIFSNYWCSMWYVSLIIFSCQCILYKTLNIDKYLVLVILAFSNTQLR